MGFKSLLVLALLLLVLASNGSDGRYLPTRSDGTRKEEIRDILQEVEPFEQQSLSSTYLVVYYNLASKTLPMFRLEQGRHSQGQNLSEDRKDVANASAMPDSMDSLFTSVPSADLNPTSPTTTPSPAPSTTTTTPASTTTTTASPTTTTQSQATTTTMSADFMARLRSMAADSLARTTPKPVPMGNFDKLLDGFLQNLAISIRESGYDPLHLAKLGPCFNCTVEGISLVRRSGPSNLAYENNTLIVDAFVTAPAVYAACDQCFIRIKSIPFGAKIEVSIWDLELYAKVAQVFKENESPQLLDYKVVNDGEVDVTISGLGVVAPAIDIGFNTFGRKFVPLVFQHVLRNEVPKLIRSQLTKFKLPTGLF